MTSARPQLMSSPRPTDRRPWLPLAGWLLVLGGLVLSGVVVDDGITWAAGALEGGARVTANEGELLEVPGYRPTILLAYGGLGFATFFGLAAVPWSRATRWALTGAMTALVVVALGVSVTVETDAPADELVGGFVIVLIPLAVLLTLVWRRLRRGCAMVALLAVGVGAVAHLVTLGRLLASQGTPTAGAWGMLAAVLLGVAGAVLAARSTPPRDRGGLIPARRG